jgi:hypothetical protein
MKWVAVVSLGLRLASSAFGQTSSVPYAFGSDGPGPTFESRQLAYSYPGTYSSIRNLNFRNFTFLNFDAVGEPAGDLTLKNGHYKEENQPFGYYSVDLDSVHYLGGPPGSGASVLILFSWFAVGGSSSQGRTARIFALTAGRLKAVQEIEWDKHFDPGSQMDFYEAKSKTLIINSAHYIPGDAHCCVSAMDVVRFRWNGAQFVQADLRTELSGYGKAQGKTLPH